MVRSTSISMLAGALLATMSGMAIAEMATTEEDNTRAVRIIEAPDPPPVTAPLSTPAVAPAPAAVAAPMPAPAASAPAPAQKAAAPGIYDVMGVKPKPAELGGTPAPQPLDYPAERKKAALGAIPIDAKVANTADLSLELLPGLDISVGAKVSFRVTTKKPGYLILVDIDANGKLTQIYPVPNVLVGARPTRPNGNYIAAGKSVQIPRSGDDYAGIEYIAAPPSGVAMIVAILSDRPVQILDLPDVPAALTGQAEALAFLTKFANELRIPPADGGRLQEARWSFDAKFYAIR